ncbi:MAG: undecaprenyldiphospho-muramoylpentapeptide beta-N-acetylglucosaminyltransferase [bacterium]|nr:undecaprenyldiphospho-muramoylpentapeptide beta-N-acetylglucosaminyltransferase [bacterium]
MNNKKIILTGGGSGGHIFPLIAVAESLKKSEPLLDIFYIGPKHSLNEEFLIRDIRVKNILNAKWRRYLSLANIFAPLKLLISFWQAFFLVLFFWPAAVFSKGGPGALPVVLAAKIFGRKIIIHESDAIPGLTNKFCGPLANRIAISFRKAAESFPVERMALTGNPIRIDFFQNIENQDEAKKYLHFDPAKKLILILGGSLGSDRINNFFLENIGFFLKDFQIFHQTGNKNIEQVKEITSSLKDYRAEGFFDLPMMKRGLAAADLIISRAGGSAIAEIAAVGKPSILIPLTEAANDHQRQNAYEYADLGAATVIEEENLTKNIVSVQIQKILEDPQQNKLMSDSAKNFAKPNAANTIAAEILGLIR